jgi:UDP-N-acetylglucosamine:LPS N-acetylglucosamine transferase
MRRVRARGRRGSCLLVASAGGHLSQLSELRGGWPREQRSWVSFDTPDVVDVLAGERVRFAYHPTNRHVVNLLRNALLAVRVVRCERPSVMVTTGAGLAVPFAYAARLVGVPVIWVEGVERVTDLSLSARLVRPVASRMFVQWPELAEREDKAEYAGSLW